VTIPAKPIRLYRHALSGHAHRVELFLSLLGLPCELIAVDMVRGAHKAPDFHRGVGCRAIRWRRPGCNCGSRWRPAN